MLNLRNIFQFRDSFQLLILRNLSSLANIFNSKIQIKLSIFRDLLFVYIDRGGGLQFLHFSLGDSYSKSALHWRLSLSNNPETSFFYLEVGLLCSSSPTSVLVSTAVALLVIKVLRYIIQPLYSFPLFALKPIKSYSHRSPLNM